MHIDVADVVGSLGDGDTITVGSVKLTLTVLRTQVIATGQGVLRLKTLRKRHGGRRWRKMKRERYRSASERVTSPS